MILQALTEYYKVMLNQDDPPDDLPLFGWSRKAVHFAAYIDLNGCLTGIVPVNGEHKKGRLITVPLQLKRSGRTPPPYFLCDSAAYVLGIGINKDKAIEVTDRSKAYFSAFSKYNLSILSSISCPEAVAVCRFLRSWDADSALENPIIRNALPLGLCKGNIVFRISDTLTWVLDAPAIQSGWDSYYQASISDEKARICLVTGEYAPIARIHNSIKNIYSDTIAPNGWTLVGFNQPAFSSYGKEQGNNAPTSQYAAFAYTTALNYLLSTECYHMGDTTVVFWAKSGEPVYQEVIGCYFDEPYNEGDLRNVVSELCMGRLAEYHEEQLDPEMDFYILGISPNTSRLSVRFFLRNTFGGFLQNLNAHQERLRIVRPSYEKFETPSLKRILDSTVNQKSKNKDASPELAGELLRAILNNTPYPTTLLNGVALRIRAEQRDKEHPKQPFKVTWPRAAVIKAYYLKNSNPDVPKEVFLAMSLNESITNPPYVLGRLFSVLEAIQQAANPNIGTTIKDKYFNSASATPSVVFPILINLAQKHLKKLSGGQYVYYEKQLGGIMALLGEIFPTRLSLPQQGAFQLGYYHQTQARYEKKEEN